jgi:hypothetical protein
VQTTKSSVVMGFLVLVILQVSIICELSENAKPQHWRHFWIDIGCLYFLAFVTGFIVMDTFNYHMRKRRGGSENK